MKHTHSLADPVAFCPWCQSVIPTAREKALYSPGPKELAFDARQARRARKAGK